MRYGAVCRVRCDVTPPQRWPYAIAFGVRPGGWLRLATYSLKCLNATEAIGYIECGPLAASNTLLHPLAQSPKSP